MRCQLRESDIEKLQYQNSPQSRLLCQLIAIWQRHRPRWHPRLPFLHDPLAIVALCSPGLLHFEVMTARVFTRSVFKGCMLPRLIDGPLVRCAIDVKREKAREWIMQRLLNRRNIRSSRCRFIAPIADVSAFTGFLISQFGEYNDVPPNDSDATLTQLAQLLDNSR